MPEKVIKEYVYYGILFKKNETDYQCLPLNTEFYNLFRCDRWFSLPEIAVLDAKCSSEAMRNYKTPMECILQRPIRLDSEFGGEKIFTLDKYKHGIVDLSLEALMDTVYNKHGVYSKIDYHDHVLYKWIVENLNKGITKISDNVIEIPLTCVKLCRNEPLEEELKKPTYDPIVVSDIVHPSEFGEIPNPIRGNKFNVTAIDDPMDFPIKGRGGFLDRIYDFSTVLKTNDHRDDIKCQIISRLAAITADIQCNIHFSDTPRFKLSASQSMLEHISGIPNCVGKFNLMLPNGVQLDCEAVQGNFPPTQIMLQHIKE